MSLRITGNRRLLAMLALAALVLSTAAALQADSAGREFSRCVQTCNETRKACRSSCSDDCGELFPGGGPDFNECRDGCRDTCNTESDDCKLVCQNIKDQPSPEEP